MKSLFLWAGLALGALAIGGWYWRDSATVRDAAQAVGLPAVESARATGPSLAAAGVHKCRSAAGVTYLDRPCPKGSQELKADGGAVTVMSFPKPAPPPAARGSGVLGSPLIKGMSPEEIDRFREKQVEDAANR